MKINVLDLFSGIGGFHLGLSRAGFEVNAFNSEVDKYAIEIYKNNFKNSTYVGSVTDVRAEQIPKIDGITFGSPCQDFSLAGKRKGLDGGRSSLILEAIRLIEECRPRFFIWENVKGTFSSNNRRDFAAILQAFANIGGYRLEWQLLNTKWFLPQNRERIYLVGYIADGSGGQIFPITEGVESNTQLEGRESYRKVINYDKQLIKVPTNNSKGYETMSQGDSLNYSNPNSKTRRGRIGKGVAQTLDTSCNQAVISNGTKVEVGDYRNDEGYRKRKDANSPTLNARARQDIFGQPIVNKMRRLTPVECERLQGFPDNWTEGVSDSQRYKMLGNAVTVDVVQEIGNRLINVI